MLCWTVVDLIIPILPEMNHLQLLQADGVLWPNPTAVFGLLPSTPLPSGICRGDTVVVVSTRFSGFSQTFSVSGLAVQSIIQGTLVHLRTNFCVALRILEWNGRFWKSKCPQGSSLGSAAAVDLFLDIQCADLSPGILRSGMAGEGRLLITLSCPLL